jgi:protein phosphatase
VSLNLTIGQYSIIGRASKNQDFVDYSTVSNSLSQEKGIVVAIADGIGSSLVSQIASETAVRSFIVDYYATNSAWSVKHAGNQVLLACHSWLLQQNRHHSYSATPEKGFCCTFSAVILRGNFAHLFHIGDTRIYRFEHQQLSLLTRDHRVWHEQKHILSQALGAQEKLNVDYDVVEITEASLFVLATDGLFEFIPLSVMTEMLANINGNTDLNDTAKQMVDFAYSNGSDDNISIQIVRVNKLPTHEYRPCILDTQLPSPEPMEVGHQIDGMTVKQILSRTTRSYVYLMQLSDGSNAVLKAPSREFADDDLALERLLQEEWIANRVHSEFTLKTVHLNKQRSALYSLFEYVDGQSLQEWRFKHPKPELESVLEIVTQIVKGVQAMHRSEILHQDIRLTNIILTKSGQIKIIDFGSAKLTGLDSDISLQIPGTALFMAPEYFLGQAGSHVSDLYSVAAVCYFLLTGQSPYGPAIARCKNIQAQQRLNYQPIIGKGNDWPEWIDLALQKALNVDPIKRYQHLSEFIYDLHKPNPTLARELSFNGNNTNRFWQLLAVFELLVIMWLSVF